MPVITSYFGHKIAEVVVTDTIFLAILQKRKNYIGKKPSVVFARQAAGYKWG